MHDWHGTGENEAWASQINDYIKRCDDIVELIDDIACRNNFDFKYKTEESFKTI